MINSISYLTSNNEVLQCRRSMEEGMFLRRRCCYQEKLWKLEAIHPWKYHEVEERWKYRNQTYFSSEILAGIPRVKKLKTHRIIRNWYVGKR